VFQEEKNSADLSYRSGKKIGCGGKKTGREGIPLLRSEQAGRGKKDSTSIEQRWPDRRVSAQRKSSPRFHLVGEET